MSAWEKPVLLEDASGRSAYVENLSSAALSFGTVFLGAPAWMLDSAHTLTIVDTTGHLARYVRAGVITDREHRELRGIPLPHARSSFRNPQSVRLGDSLVVVWASDSVRDGVPVWSAAFGARGWSEPTPVGVIPALPWLWTGRTPLIAHGDTLEMVAALFGAREGSAIHLRRIKGTWSTSAFRPGDLFVSYPQLVVSGGRHYLGFVSAVRPADRNVVYLAESSDAGRTWGTPTRISRAGEVNAADLALLADEHTLYAVWWELGSRALGREADSIRVMTRPLDGVAWTDRGALAIRPGASNPNSVLDAHGHVHVVFRTPSGPRGEMRIAAATWGPSAWQSSAVSDIGSESATNPVVGIVNRDTLVATWGVWRAAKPAAIPLTVMSRATIKCAMPPTRNEHRR